MFLSMLVTLPRFHPRLVCLQHLCCPLFVVHPVLVCLSRLLKHSIHFGFLLKHNKKRQKERSHLRQTPSKMNAWSGSHWLYLSGRIKGVFASSHARVRNARHWWWTQNESIFALVIVNFPISTFAGRPSSGSRPWRLKECVHILCGCPKRWKTLKMLACMKKSANVSTELRLKCNKLWEQCN